MSELDELYARVPELACQGHCRDSCGPIPAGPAERARVAERGVELPVITTAEQATKAMTEGVYDCPALSAFGRCGVYEVRPMVCRLWGVAEGMPCPWGCMPEGGRLRDSEAFRLLGAAVRSPVPRRGRARAASPERR